MGAFSPLLPEIGRAGGLADWQLGVVAGALGFARMATAIPAGWLAGRYLGTTLWASPTLMLAGTLLLASMRRLGPAPGARRRPPPGAPSPALTPGFAVPTLARRSCPDAPPPPRQCADGVSRSYALPPPADHRVHQRGPIVGPASVSPRAGPRDRVQRVLGRLLDLRVVLLPQVRADAAVQPARPGLPAQGRQGHLGRGATRAGDRGRLARRSCPEPGGAQRCRVSEARTTQQAHDVPPWSNAPRRSSGLTTKCWRVNLRGGRDSLSLAPRRGGEPSQRSPSEFEPAQTMPIWSPRPERSSVPNWATQKEKGT